VVQLSNRILAKFIVTDVGVFSMHTLFVVGGSGWILVNVQSSTILH